MIECTQMTEDDFVSSLLENHDKLRQCLNDSYEKSLMDNIKQQRNLVSSFITISAAIIGLTIPVMGNSQLVQSRLLLSGGLAELLIVILYGFWYLRTIIQRDNNQLVLAFDQMSNYLDRKHAADLKYIKNMTKKGSEEWERENDSIASDLLPSPINLVKDWAVDIIYFAFFIALVLIILSMILRV